MSKQGTNSSFTLRWFLQAGSGIMLLLLLAIHLIVNHWVAPHGLLRYADVIRYYDVAGVAYMEAIFLIIVTGHCLLGLHSIVLDLNLKPDINRRLTRLLIVMGVGTVLYGVWLIRAIALLSAA